MGDLLSGEELVVNGLRAFIDTNGIGLGAGGSVANQEIIGPVAGRFTSMHNFWIELLVERFNSCTINTNLVNKCYFKTF